MQIKMLGAHEDALVGIQVELLGPFFRITYLKTIGAHHTVARPSKTGFNNSLIT